MTLAEKIARAMCKEAGHDPERDDQVFAPPGLLNWQLYKEEALAVLLAIREPSEAMREAAFAALPPSPDAAPVGSEWQAMIDAAIAETKEGTK